MQYSRKVEETLGATSERPVPPDTGPGFLANLIIKPTWSADKHRITLHPPGGCPRGGAEILGAVSPNGELFHYPGLYVTDASSIPLAPGATASKTIDAVSVRVAGHIPGQGF